jgi:N-acetylmuramoyl-L-alanine amidase
MHKGLAGLLATVTLLASWLPTALAAPPQARRVVAKPQPPQLVVDPWCPKPVQLQHVHRLVLDPGHGGDNLGTIGQLGVREKNLSLDYARRIAKYVREHSNVEVELTRESDVAVALRDRPRIANDKHADALVSLHANAHELGEAHGMEVFFLAADSSVQATRELIEREEGIRPDDSTAALPWSVGGIVQDLDHSAAHAHAEVLAGSLALALQKVRPTVRFRGMRQAPFGVLKEARMPAVVLEVGYLTHPQEARQLLEPGVPVQFAQAILLALQGLDARIELETNPPNPGKKVVHVTRR